MKIAVVSEVSAADKNPAIIAALQGRGHEIHNVGMKAAMDRPPLTYIHTGFLGATLLMLGRVDFVIGGCGTGQGFLNSVLQYPGVCCGLMTEPLDAWLFAQINGGNCISLALNKGFGWAGEVTLSFILDQLFAVERGIGYPPHRRESQRESRLMLERLNLVTHRKFAEIIEDLPDDVIRPVFDFPGVSALVDVPSIGDEATRRAFDARLR